MNSKGFRSESGPFPEPEPKAKKILAAMYAENDFYALSSSGAVREAFLTPLEYAGKMRVSIRTVYELLRAGKIRAKRVGRQWRIYEMDEG